MRFSAGAKPELASSDATLHVLLDARVQELHESALEAILGCAASVSEPIVITASEDAKTYAALEAYAGALLARGVRRGDLLLAIGGGVLQDITCFLASVLFRGMRWGFLPTTLLSQADSCIGSKSSINLGATKNQLGTFWAPAFVEIWSGFLGSLPERELRSGVGEIYKIHIIAGPEHFAAFDRIYRGSPQGWQGLGPLVRAALELKKPYVETDELDRGPRAVLNYGHTFGHALEAASGFALPHGIAVAMGMDMANVVARDMGRIDSAQYASMAGALRALVLPEHHVPIDFAAFCAAFGRDKKHVARGMRLVLLNRDLVPELVTVDEGADLQARCQKYLRERAECESEEWHRRAGVGELR